MKNENGNLIFQTSYLHYLPLVFGIVASAALTIYGMIYWEWSIQWVRIYSYNIPLLIFALPGVIFLVVLLFQAHNEKLILTPQYALFIQGILRWRQNSVRMEYQSIKEVNIEETILQRLLGLGDIRCTTVVSVGQQYATMPGLRNPRRVKDIILDRIRASGNN